MAILKRQGATNQGFQSIVLKDDCNPYFIYSMGPVIKEKAEGVASGSTFLEISGKMLGNIEIAVPSKPEQDAIAEYFERLDDLITLHQRGANSWGHVRFRRFCSATIFWEQRKLGELVGVYDGTHQTPEYTSDGIMFLSVENIKSLKSEKFISEEAFYRDYKVYPQEGDVLMTRIGDVGTPNVVETTDKIAFYVSLALLKPLKIDSYFLCYNICSTSFQLGLKERTLVTAIPQKINKDEIGKVDLLTSPVRGEQQKIGDFFRNLDRLITLHQREFTHTNPNTNYVKYYQRNRPLLCVLRSMDKSV